ncbi:ventrally expressed dharma/bozozok antagonist isoform X2 [Clinocottus analis]
MSQSSQPTGSSSGPEPRPGPVACGTHSESLPGFYCRAKSESSPKQRDARSLQHHVTEAAFSSGTEEEEEEEETSGYESEGGQSLSPTAAAHCPSSSISSSSSSTSSSSSSPPLGRRPRTAFTAEQISSLERSFKRNAYLGTQDKTELCRKLQLSDKQIRNWFQNRRMKLKRTVQDALAHACHANAAAQFLHYPELQAYRPAPYPRYQDPAAAGAPYGPPHGLQCGAALPLDSFQYSNLPGVVMPPQYPQYY